MPEDNELVNDAASILRGLSEFQRQADLMRPMMQMVAMAYLEFTQAGIEKRQAIALAGETLRVMIAQSKEANQ
jgi:hypothetical protein